MIVIKDKERKKKLINILKEEKNEKSDKSSDVDYDQMMAQGTIIVIKDDLKKKKYL